MSDQDAEQKFKEKCEDLLAQIQHLDTEIEAAGADKKRSKQLQRDKADLHRQFAVYLRDSGKDGYQNPSWSVWARWLVEGVPSKKAREEAHAWMAARHGYEWTGFAPNLRADVLSALRSDEQIPEGYFGLHVEWTVEVHGRVRHRDAV